MDAVIWILTGLLAGSVARIAMKSSPGALGVVHDVSLGLFGGVFGGALFRLIGATPREGGLSHFVTAVIGAMVAIMLARTAREAASRGMSEVERLRLLDIDAQMKRLGISPAAFDVFKVGPLSVDATAKYEERRTLGERAADRIASFGGSWTFIGLFMTFLTLWMAYNVRAAEAFDPYPFILLNLMLSCIAALQAPIIMMSQGRQAATDRVEARNDYEVNLKAEVEIAALHIKIDELRNAQWTELIELQRKQIEMLEAALAKRVEGASHP
jgi:uncharacterized membrane protein/uncharacterized membrane protein YeaQ/YmgE (transglycosylase-associated protein family)